MRYMSEAWPEARSGRDGMHNGLVCSCRSCRVRRSDLVERLADQSLSTALRHSQDEGREAEWEAGRRSSTSLPSIGRIPWSAPVSIGDLKAGAPAAGPFRAKGKYRLYRICRPGGRHPLYVGMVHGATQSVSGRINDHLSGKGAGKTDLSTTKRLHDELKGMSAQDRNRLLVRFAEPPVPPALKGSPQFLHAVELLAQQAMRAKHRNRGNVVTFEDEGEEGYPGFEAPGAWRQHLKRFATRMGLAAVLAGGAVPGPAGEVVRDLGRAVATLGGAQTERRRYPVDSPPRSDPGGAGPPR
jgi:hypothetical protein